ncbi:MAG: GNAT family N-acetyltransferase [Chloroflexota bacterium]
MIDEIELRTPTLIELRTLRKVINRAFGEETAEAAFDEGLESFEVDRSVAAFDGADPVAMSGADSFRLTVPGRREVAAAGITAVAVSPSHRRRGILTRMMRWLIDDARRRGDPIAILSASEGAIYQRFGYGLGTYEGSFEIDRRSVAFERPPPVDGRIRMPDADEALGSFPTIYEAVRRRLPGALTRSEDRWRSTLRDADWNRWGRGPKFLALLEVGDEPAAYVIYHVKDDWDERGPKNRLEVMELLGRDAASEQAMWRWALDIDLVATIKGSRQPIPHPLILQLSEPRRLGLHAKDGLWLRIVELPAALEARGYGADGRLVFDMTDDFCPWNAGRWALTVSGGTPSIGPAEAAPDVRLDAADLACVYLGAVRFADLAAAGRVEPCHEEAVGLADRMFSADRAPWCSTRF